MFQGFQGIPFQWLFQGFSISFGGVSGGFKNNPWVSWAFKTVPEHFRGVPKSLECIAGVF